MEDARPLKRHRVEMADMNTDDVDVKRAIVGLSSSDDDEDELGVLKVRPRALYALGCLSV